MKDLINSKVTFVHPDLGIGGAERLVLDVAIALSKAGCKVNFLTNHFQKNHSFKELQDGTFDVKVVGDWLPRDVLGKFHALCAYFRMLYLSLFYLFFWIGKKPDLYFVDQIPIAIPFIKFKGGKVVYYCHHPDLLASAPGGILKKMYRKPIDWLEQMGTSLADIILVNSKYTASVFRETFPKIQKKITILYPTISENLYKSISLKKTVKSINELIPELINVKCDKFVFLSVNRFHPAKQLELAIMALAELKKIVSENLFQNTYVIIAGGHDPRSSINASYFNQLVDLVNEFKLNKQVIFLKSPSESLKTDLLLSCDCLLYTPEKEHFGIVPLEAMAAYKPVIALDSGGPKETVLHEETGYLSECHPVGIAACMKKVLDKDVARKLGSKGRERLEEMFTNSVFQNSVINIVGEFLNK